MKINVFNTYDGQINETLLAVVNDRLWKAEKDSFVFSEIAAVEINGKREYHERPEKTIDKLVNNQPFNVDKIESQRPYRVWAKSKIETVAILEIAIKDYLNKVKRYHDLLLLMENSGMARRQGGRLEIHRYMSSHFDRMDVDIAEGKDCDQVMAWAEKKCTRLKESGKLPNFSVCTISWIEE